MVGNMPNVHTYRCQLAAPPFNEMQLELFALPEYPGPTKRGWLVGLDGVKGLMQQSRRADLVVRFYDCGFDEITTAWRWLGDGVGLASLIVNGGIGQVHLMLSGMPTEDRSVASDWLKRAGIIPTTAFPRQPMVSLITVEREGYDDEHCGFVLGMILTAPFCDCCGVPEDPA